VNTVWEPVFHYSQIKSNVKKKHELFIKPTYFEPEIVDLESAVVN
jgi:hypothetical protein